jgi:bZIP-type transcription factor MBZ1
MQLWGKIAAQYQWQQQLQHQQLQQQQQLGTQQQQQQLTGLAAGLKPHFFQGHGANVGLSGVLSGKGVPNKPLGTITNLAGSTSSSPAQPTREQAYLAALASDTLVRRLGGAFWDAFSGTPSPPSKASPSMWDPEKVRRVLEGKAVVRVVDVDAPLMSGSASPSPSSRSVPVSPRLGARAGEKKEKEKEKDKCCVLTDILAESMGGLSLGKK